MVRLVKLGDQRPLILKKADIPGAIIAVCRCGLSAAWPLCDGSHVNTHGEAQGKLYYYERVPKGTDEELLERHELHVEDHPGPVRASQDSIDRSYA